MNIRATCLAAVVTLLFTAASHAQDTPSARDLVDPAQSAPLRFPPLPSDYVTVHRGPVEIAYPRALERVVRDAVEHAEHDAAVEAGQLGLRGDDPLHVRLVPDPDTMRRLAPTDAPPPQYAVGVAYPSAGVALVSATAPASWDASDMRRVLRHELSHLLLEIAVGHAPIPRWFSEGVAIHQSGEHSYERFKTLAVTTFTHALVPLASLDGSFSRSSDEVNVAYAEAADFVAFIQTRDGDARFAVVLAHLREGMTFDDAVHQTYRVSLAVIESEWKQDVQSRFLTAPLWAGTGLFWCVGMVVMFLAMFKRRARSRATIARWAREESAASALAVTIVTPGLGGQHHASRESSPDVDPDALKLPN